MHEALDSQYERKPDVVESKCIQFQHHLEGRGKRIRTSKARLRQSEFETIYLGTETNWVNGSWLAVQI